MTADLQNRIAGAGNRIFTVIGAVAGFLVAVGQYLAFIPPQYQSSRWYIVAAGLVAAGAWWKKNAAVAEDPSPKTPVMFALLAASSLLAFPAYAEDPQPSALGGVFKVGNVTAAYGPRLLPGMMALNFKTGDVAVVGIGGLAYGCDFFADKPYSIGAAAFLGAQVGKEDIPSSISAGVVATLFHYAVIGWHHGVTGGVKTDNFVAGPSVAF